MKDYTIVIHDYFLKKINLLTALLISLLGRLHRVTKARALTALLQGRICLLHVRKPRSA